MRSPPVTRLVLASSNQGKLKELQALLAPSGLTVHSQSEFSVPDVEETGLTFVENAILKARNAAQYCNMPAVADDSGLEVDALNGAPGIYSARYAGIGASDQQNLEKLLSAMQDVPDAQRGARFQCLLVMMRHAQDATPIICQGTWQGRIQRTPSGNNGFGYDPIFYVAEHLCTAAELGPDLKNKLSHRGRALRQLVGFLINQNFGVQ